MKAMHPYVAPHIYQVSEEVSLIASALELCMIEAEIPPHPCEPQPHMSHNFGGHGGFFSGVGPPAC